MATARACFPLLLFLVSCGYEGSGGSVARNPSETDAMKAPQRSKSGYDVTPWTPAQREERAADLEPLERAVTCEAGTERAFTGKFWDHHADGTYTCVICALPLFKSATKFDSGTGWPSFFQPFDPQHVAEHKDVTHGMVRVEIRCARCSAHLGHVFPDGPRPTGQRYCMNSAAMDFVPASEPLKKDG